MSYTPQEHDDNITMNVPTYPPEEIQLSTMHIHDVVTWIR